jgi:hypothetical protein
MHIYAGLFESMMACCGRLGGGRAPLYTLTMMALGVAVTLNLLSVIDLLWTLGVVDNPYRIDGDLHSRRYIFGVLYIAFLANTVLARRKFRADQIAMARLAASAAAAPVYVLASTGLFIITLSKSLRSLG